MSQPAEQTQTPANSAVRNTVGKGSKQAPDNNPGESSWQHSQTRGETIFFESESCDRQRKARKKIRTSPASALGDTYYSQNTSVFSRLRREEAKPTRRRSPVSTTVFTKLGDRDRNVFQRLGERKKDIHSRLGPEVAPRRRHASERRSASTGKSAGDPNKIRKEARNLIRSYVTCFGER
ncbi:hypothetical protein Tco_0299474 [Tanacetum coccineum]